MIKENIKKVLEEKTNEKIHEFFSPARINLIGEHIDYVGGSVVPAAINLGITAFAAKSKNIEVASANFGMKWHTENNFSFDFKYDEKNSFMNFIFGALIELKKEVGDKLDENMGFELILSSSIPIASGLSSSAALGMLILEIMDSLYGLKLDKVKKALIFQRVENNFIGLKSGIMDQFAIGLGRKNHFIKLDTSTLDYEYIEMNQSDYRFILLSTNKSRELADSSYNERVEQLSRVAKQLNMNFKDLYKANENDLNKIQDPILNKRLKHVINEVKRVKLIIDNLKQMNGKELGNILNETHKSLKNDYQVSCDELDFIQTKMKKLDGVFGLRMIGAGFGGCLLAAVKTDFNIRTIRFNEEYKKQFGMNFDVYEFEVSDGIKEII